MGERGWRVGLLDVRWSIVGSVFTHAAFVRVGPLIAEEGGAAVPAMWAKG
jgi:hypothetical protein